LFSAAVHAGVDGVAVKTYFQANELEPFLVQSLDLATFRNSLSPRRHETHQPFAMLAIAPTKILPGRVVFDGDVWCSPLPVIRHAEFLAIRVTPKNPGLGELLHSRQATNHPAWIAYSHNMGRNSSSYNAAGSNGCVLTNRNPWQNNAATTNPYIGADLHRKSKIAAPLKAFSSNH